MVNRTCLKLSAKYFGPYKVLAKVGSVAYKLELPVETKVHPVFHVSQLKKHVGAAPVQSQLPLLDADGVLSKEPIAIMDRRINKRKGQAITEVLVHWSNCFPEDATWECLFDLQQRFPLILEDKDCVKEKVFVVSQNTEVIFYFILHVYISG